MKFLLAQANSCFSSFCQPLLLDLVLARFWATLSKLGSSKERDTQLRSHPLSDWPADKPVGHFLDCKIGVKRHSRLWAMPPLGNLEYYESQLSKPKGKSQQAVSLGEVCNSFCPAFLSSLPSLHAGLEINPFLFKVLLVMEFYHSHQNLRQPSAGISVALLGGHCPHPSTCSPLGAVELLGACSGVVKKHPPPLLPFPPFLCL